MSGYVGNKRSVSFVSAELPIRKGLESIVEEDGSYRLLDGASLKRSDGNTVIHSDGTIEGVDLSPIQNQIDSIEADITSLNSSVDLVEASVNQIPPRLESFRNRIINGDMQIDQRNAGSAITNPNVQFPVDRFGVSQYIADTTTQRSSDAPTGFKNSLLITNGTATAVPVSSYNYTCYQKIEGYNIDDLGFASTDAKSITVSFWVKTSLDATFAVSILNAAEDRSYVHTFEIENTNTWEYKSFTLTADQDTGSNWLDSTGTGLRLNFDLGSGADYNTSTLNAWQSGKKFRTSSSANFNNSTNATFYITGVQLEEGTIATPFEHRPYGLELSLCQRYFSQTWGKWYGVTQAAGFFEGCAITWPVEMRTAPTTTVSDFYTGDPTNFTDISKVGLTDVRSTGAWFWASPAKVGGNVFVRAKCQAEAEL